MATRGSKAKKGSPQLGIKITLDGHAYLFDIAQTTGQDRLECRNATGMSVQRVLDLMNQDPDLDLIGVVVWLARRQSGERGLALRDVLTEITTDSDLGITAADDSDSEPEDPNHPES